MAETLRTLVGNSGWSPSVVIEGWSCVSRHSFIHLFARAIFASDQRFRVGVLALMKRDDGSSAFVNAYTVNLDY